MNIPEKLKNAAYVSAPLDGIPQKDGFQRLDPSNIIFYERKYYAYWTRAEEKTNLYSGSIFCGTSEDGIVWTELGEVLSRSEGDGWDNFGVITPYVVPERNGFYLFYTSSHKSEGENWEVRGEKNKRNIGVAFSEKPYLPFARISSSPLLSPSESGWDSYLVDDTHIMKSGGKYYLYYKGGDKEVTPSTTRWGLAVSDTVCGPYKKYEDNPVTDSGHTVCIIRYGRGLIALFDNAGPCRHSIGYSENGICFEHVKNLGHVDTGCGAFDKAAFDCISSEPDLVWGLTAEIECEIPYLKRFELHF